MTLEEKIEILLMKIQELEERLNKLEENKKWKKKK